MASPESAAGGYLRGSVSGVGEPKIKDKVEHQIKRAGNCIRAVLQRRQQKTICRPGPGQRECMKAKHSVFVAHENG